jgi:hypothetical protein
MPIADKSATLLRKRVKVQNTTSRFKYHMSLGIVRIKYVQGELFSSGESVHLAHQTAPPQYQVVLGMTFPLVPHPQHVQNQSRRILGSGWRGSIRGNGLDCMFSSLGLLEDSEEKNLNKIFHTGYYDDGATCS